MSGLLVLHIVVAVVTIVASATSLAAVWRNKWVSANLRAMWGSFIVTASTGVALVVLTPSTLMHTCVLMTAYIVALTTVQVYANRRAAARV